MQVEVNTASGCELFYEFDRFEKERDRFNYSFADKKTATIFLNTRAEVRASETKGSVTVGGSYSWGGSEENQFKGYVKGDVHDNKGNHAYIKIEQGSDGKGNVTGAANHEFNSGGNGSKK